MNESLRSAVDHRVDFVIGGVQKGGTTALDKILRRHPDIAMAREKEPHMFDDDEAFDIWTKKVGLSPDKVFRFGEKENFWPAEAPSKGASSVMKFAEVAEGP